MDSDPGSDPVGGAYVRAVAAATLTLVGWQLLRNLLHPRWFELVLMTPLVFLVVGIVIFLTALLPFLMVRWLAKTLSIHSIWYFVICGAAIGLLLLPLAIFMLPYPAYDDMPPEPPFSDTFVSSAPLFAIAGAIGALAYRWRAGRFIGRDTAPQAID
jgi:hypothetical protein